MPLNEKQKRFCEEYLIDMNGTKAAIRAGYSPRTANEQAAQSLAKLSIQQYLQELRTKQAERTGITADRVLQEYARLAFSDIRKFYTAENALKDIHELDDDAAAALAGIEVTEETEFVDGQKVNTGWTKKIKTYDKTKALEALGKHLGIFEKDNAQAKPVTNITIEL